MIMMMKMTMKMMIMMMMIMMMIMINKWIYMTYRPEVSASRVLELTVCQQNMTMGPQYVKSVILT